MLLANMIIIRQIRILGLIALLMQLCIAQEDKLRPFYEKIRYDYDVAFVDDLNRKRAYSQTSDFNVEKDRDWYLEHHWIQEGRGLEHFDAEMRKEREKLSQTPEGQKIIHLVDKTKIFYLHIEEGYSAAELLAEVTALIEEYRDYYREYNHDLKEGERYLMLRSLIEKKAFLDSWEGKLPIKDVPLLCSLKPLCGQKDVVVMNMYPFIIYDVMYVHGLAEGIHSNMSLKEVIKVWETKYGEYALPYILRVKLIFEMMNRHDAERLEQLAKKIASYSTGYPCQRDSIVDETLDYYWSSPRACHTSIFPSNYENWKKAALIYLNYFPDSFTCQRLHSLSWFERDEEQMSKLHELKSEMDNKEIRRRFKQDEKPNAKWKKGKMKTTTTSKLNVSEFHFDI